MCTVCTAGFALLPEDVQRGDELIAAAFLSYESTCVTKDLLNQIPTL